MSELMSKKWGEFWGFDADARRDASKQERGKLITVAFIQNFYDKFWLKADELTDKYFE